MFRYPDYCVKSHYADSHNSYVCIIMYKDEDCQAKYATTFCEHASINPARSLAADSKQEKGVVRKYREFESFKLPVFSGSVSAEFMTFMKKTDDQAF